MRVSTWVGGAAVAAFVVVSTVMAARFGWSLGTTVFDRVLYAAAGGFADLLKTFLPLFVVTAFLARQWVRTVAGGALFLVVTAFSLSSSFGLAAIQRTDKIGEHTATATAYQDRRADLERLIAERAKIDARPLAANAEVLAAASVQRAEASVVSECAKRGPECRKLEAIARAARDDLAAIVTAKAVAQAAVALDNRIEDARTALGRVDAGEASEEADPQSAALARLTGRSEDGVRTALHVLIAVLLEFGSGLGLFVVFGPRGVHDGGRPAPTPAQSTKNDVPATPVVIEDCLGAIKRFVAEQLRPVDGGRVSGSELFAAYERWCERQGIAPVSGAAFGRQVPWTKGRVGGRVWYFDAALAA
jgi:hypothetical protein